MPATGPATNLRAQEASASSTNLIPNGDFAQGRLGGLPEGWELNCKYDFLKPEFGLVKRQGRQVLEARGAGNPDCVAWVYRRFPVERGKTYRLRARFSMTPGVNPQFNLLFSFYAMGPDGKSDFNHGIFHFRRLPGGRAEGESRFLVPGAGTATGEARLAYRLNANGRVWFESVALEQCEPIAPRPVRLACVENTTPEEHKLDPRNASWAAVADAAAIGGADLLLYPEYMNGATPETLAGSSCRMMAAKARQHRMYICGGIVLKDEPRSRIYNAALLYDRTGKLVGRYDKIHPYSPELMNEGITPGTEVPVFDLDFGRVGLMTCADNWFGDVAELAALKGAEIILFPNAGHYRSLMPARAADNGTRIVASTHYVPLGMWDTSGADVTNPGLDPTRYANNDATFRDVKQTHVGEIKLLMATFDLSQSPQPHNWGGPMMSAMGGQRNRREQKVLLYDPIRREAERWWDEPPAGSPFN